MAKQRTAPVARASLRVLPVAVIDRDTHGDAVHANAVVQTSRGHWRTAPKTDCFPAIHAGEFVAGDGQSQGDLTLSFGGRARRGRPPGLPPVAWRSA